MALSSTSRPSLRGRILSRLPATLTAIGGIAVEKLNGIWTIFPDFSSLTALTSLSLSDPSLKQIWVYDPLTEVYNVLTLAGLGEALHSATSLSSVSVGVGSKTFIIQSGKDFPVGSWIAAIGTDPANYMVGQVTAYTGTSLTATMTAYGGSGTLASWSIRGSSPPGSAGKSAGYLYSWLTDTTSSDPTDGKVKVNNATFGSITEVYISETDADANGIAAVVAAALAGTSTKKCRVKIYDPLTPTNFMEFDATAITDNGTWVTLTATPKSSGGSFTAALSLRVDFYPVGDRGETGASFAATSVTSNSIASSGTKTFTTQSGLAYQAGTRVRASDTSAPSTNWMEGVVSSYSGTTLAFTADKSLGSGTLTAWLLNIAGQPGVDGGGLANVVDDTTPQLGGMLDVNGQSLGDGTLELLKFVETASAVNEITITNAATGNGPSVSATGDNTNIDLNLVPKGTGSVNLLDKPLQRPEIKDYAETVNAIGSTGGGTQDIDLTLGNVVSATVDTSANTFTFSNPSASGKACSFTLILTNGGSQTVNWPASVKWPGGTPPTLTASGRDRLVFSTENGGTTWDGMVAGKAFA